MPLTDILLTSLVISIFCAGLSLISREGNILHFLRKPFEDFPEKHYLKERPFEWRFPITYNLTTVFYYIVNFLSKPLIMCCTCMASIWGIVIYYSLHGWAWQMIVCCIASAFLNTLFINLIEKLES